MEQGHRWAEGTGGSLCSQCGSCLQKGLGSPALISRGLDGCLSTPSHVASLLRHQGLPRTLPLLWLCSRSPQGSPPLLGPGDGNLSPKASVGCGLQVKPWGRDGPPPPGVFPWPVPTAQVRGGKPIELRGPSCPVALPVIGPVLFHRTGLSPSYPLRVPAFPPPTHPLPAAW